MRNNHIGLVVMMGGLLLPAVMFVTTLDGPAEGLSDTERHGVVAIPVVGQSTEAPVEGTAPEAPGANEPLSAAEQELVEWARHRFSLVGLELPDVEVTFHDDIASCGGNPGRYRGSRERRHIAVCVPDWGTFASDLQRQRTLVHEFAHAWDHANLDPRRRVELLEALGATDWYAPEQQWEERGVERFAETIVWGLYDQLRRPTLIDVPCQDLHDDFLLITGFTALGAFEPVCDPTSATPRQT